MKFLRLVLPGVTMIAVTYGLARFSFGLLLPEVNKSLEMTELVSGIISSLFYLAYCFTIILSTVITTKEGPRRMIISAGLSAFVGLLLISIATNVWVLALGVLFAGGSTGLVSPPYGAAISLWIKEHKQGKANTWINSGTSFGIALSGVGASFLTSDWRLTYFIYAILTLLIVIWNFQAIPKAGTKPPKLRLKKGNLSIRGVKGSNPLILASLTLGFSTAAFWTFSRSFIEVSGNYSDWQLSGFWIVIGLFGVLGGFSGSLVERKGLPFVYKLGGMSIASSSIILSITSGNWFMSYISAGIFGCAYIFLTGVLLVWGIRVFFTNASLGIGVPFLLLAVGQVIGSIFAGWFIGAWGYVTTFIIYGLVGMAAILMGPKKE
ncbi:MFS transporter [Virgibacillus salexigens]|uniref:Purine efflux pump PbuE n=2 Tax=Virgibacillus TaxID=84406 RepID=A0A024QGF8_9BACI|nr:MULTISPECIES: MFS transporter [Virgibacillus]MYL43525.1 MFS transporter [Virgibacillus massiliensis]GGJ72127.1 MFS transporter [Virgibacillus kapii]CDQ41290.1 Purine efflux pump PbuE [Virgibacillus massiliensis]